MRRAAKLLTIASLLLACSDQSPRPYSITGAWQGSTALGFLAVTLSQSGQTVTGSGRFRPAGESERSITVSGQLNPDSSLFVSVAMVPDGVNAPCSGNLQGVYRMAESNAGRFVAHFLCGNWSFQAPVNRQ